MRIKRKFFTTLLFATALTSTLYILAPDNNLHKKRIDEFFIKNIISQNLVIKKIEITGTKELSRESILNVVSAEKGRPIFEFDTIKIRENIESISWVERAEVKRILNGTINIIVFEKSPIALWKKDKELFLIDTKGEIIEKNKSKKFLNLPMILGEEAPKYINELLSMLKKFPNIYENIHHFQRVGNRRWNLRLNDDSTILLPEKNYMFALEQLSSLEEKEKILSKKKVNIDMRIPKKIIFKALQ